MTRRTAEEQLTAAGDATLPAQPSQDYQPESIFSASFAIPIRIRPRAEDDAHVAKKITTTIIRANLLIPGDGEPVRYAALVVENKLIAWVGGWLDLPRKYTEAPHKAYAVPYLMPGLWECHVHLMGGGIDDGAGYVSVIASHPASGGARIARGCWESIQRGYTSFRDVGGFGCEIAKAIDDGSIIGPNIYSSGACLSQTAGHGDVFPLPAGDVLLNLGVSTVTPGHFSTNMLCLVDGEDECRRGVRLQIRRGAKCIKLFASGGVMSRDDNPLYAQFSKKELETVVEEASRQGRSVAAHAHGKPGILAAVNAGVTTVEHASFADKECIDLMKQKGTVYVATRTVVELLLSTGGQGLPRQTWEKAKLVGTNHLEAYKRAIEAGVPIALGTDTGPGFNMAMELEYAVKAGMTNLEAIKAATANGPLTVGEMAPKTGQLKVGYEADLVGLMENPAEDVRVLQKRENIKWVWKGGKILKGPGVGPWGEE